MPAARATEGRIPQQSAAKPGIRTAGLIVGQPFNPWGARFGGMFCSEIVRRQRRKKGHPDGVTDGQKLLYDYLLRRAGDKGECWPSKETVAEDLGKSVGQIEDDLQALERQQLIGHRKRDGRKSNTYFFLYHSLFEQQSTTVQPDVDDPRKSARTTARKQWSTTGQNHLNSSPPPPNLFSDESKPVESSSEDCSGVECTTAEQDPDEEERAPQDIQTINNPSDPPRIAVSVIADEHTLQPSDKSPTGGDRHERARADAEITFAADQLHNSRNLGKLKGKIAPPGPVQTAAILRCFQNRKHFIVWLDEFDRQGKQDRIRAEGDGFGFYLADAKKNAGRIWQEMTGEAKPGDSLAEKLKARRQARGAAA